MASEFVEHCLENCGDGTHVSAILPEVLRTGTSYTAWREMVSGLAILEQVTSEGRFESFCDVDVFIAHWIVGAGEKQSDWGAKPSKGLTIGDLCEVQTGRVVPHRHPEVRRTATAFMDARSSPAWGTVRRIKEQRSFATAPFSPPFMVVRRTSRPGDRNRIVPTIVEGRRPVQVENHLVVLTPRSGDIDTLVGLVDSLRDKRTTAWLNANIRCRHLTVQSISQTPVFSVR